jgi:predicted porin
VCVILYKITFIINLFYYEEKIMDKKILLSGAAALIMGAGLFAAPASASITIEHSGEASLSILMSDHCNYTQADIDDSPDTTVNSGATTPNATCASKGEENPLWTTDSKLDWSASGTLANGLSVSTSQDADINLSGAFGSVTFKSGGDSAVKASMVNSDGDVDVEGEFNLKGHSTATSGTDKMVVTYQAPSMGGMDLFVSYAPNSAGTKYDNAAYTDTIGFGASFNLDAMSISAGYETATANTAGNCGAAPAGLGTAATASTGVAVQADELAGGAYCGDMTLMAFGASMSAGELSINGGYSKLDTEEADQTTLNVGLGMDVGAYSLGLDYVNNTKDYLLATADKQTVIGLSATTALGDGVDLGLSFSNNSYNVANTGAHTNYRAEAKITVNY